jgi:hypothetical protein
MTVKSIAILLGALISVPVGAQTAALHHFTITKEQVAQSVAQALADRGVSISENQVALLAEVVATEPYPTFEVGPLLPLVERSPEDHSDTRSKVMLTCRDAGTCIPFYAVVTGAMGSNGRVNATSNGPTSNGSAGYLSGGPAPKLAVTMKAGTHATLVMDDDRARIKVAVISLEDGVAGHKIRVTSPDRKQTYTAEVVSANLLKASF